MYYPRSSVDFLRQSLNLVYCQIRSRAVQLRLRRPAPFAEYVYRLAPYQALQHGLDLGQARLDHIQTLHHLIMLVMLSFTMLTTAVLLAAMATLAVLTFAFVHTSHLVH